MDRRSSTQVNTTSQGRRRPAQNSAGERDNIAIDRYRKEQDSWKRFTAQGNNASGQSATKTDQTLREMAKHMDEHKSKLIYGSTVTAGEYTLI